MYKTINCKKLSQLIVQLENGFSSASDDTNYNECLVRSRQKRRVKLPSICTALCEERTGRKLWAIFKIKKISSLLLCSSFPIFLPFAAVVAAFSKAPTPLHQSSIKLLSKGSKSIGVAASTSNTT